ncbi:hypothetical protein NQ317_010140 [Molorchus minor]|uniref:Uncharacterized protein n=1 Tax=Molorchus minor TaxID=1323400 RepID=A0ABQ9JH75_9CUCU|nr:hypothetical protein NQ317_010140 [Molorchus minor]
MDSFYDVPRRAPVPTPYRKAPVVPEVSMICHQKTTTNDYMPYHNWKIQQNCNILTSNRENIRPRTFNRSPQDTSHILKKHVRFESPMLQQRPSLTYEPFNKKKVVVQTENACARVIDEPDGVTKCTPPLNGKTFEEIYMANVPMRQLDLSIIDLPNNAKKAVKTPVVSEEKINDSTDIKNENLRQIEKDKENVMPKTYREFLETQRKVARENKRDVNDSVTDIFNYKKSKTFNNSKNIEQNKQFINETNLNTFKCIKNDETARLKEAERKNSYDLPVRNNSDTQTSVFHVTQQTDDKPEEKNDALEITNKDLLKIIAQQNEQLLILQKQVAMLLNKDHPKQIEAGYQHANENCITSTQNENFRRLSQDTMNTPRKRGMSKFSIDLMTSFEVAIRPQHNKQNFVNYEPKIQEITETDSVTIGAESEKNDKTVVDSSLHLQEPVRVREMCPSPEPSININMNDYDSSEDDEVTASEIGATFYHNLMGQVNNILKKAQVQTREDFSGRECRKNAVYSENGRDKTMDRVKEATLKHLRSIGVTIGSMDTSDSINFGNESRDYSPTEVSFAVKQILMKYLPDDQLAKIQCKQGPGMADKAKNPEVFAQRPEFSFASVEYMRKYNLIPNNEVNPKEQVAKLPNAQKMEGPKILDITALKMQPKLL